MVTRIRKGSRPHLYIDEWMEKRGLNYETLGARMGVSRTTVWRWAREQWRLDPGKMHALAEALDHESAAALYRPPERPSIDAILNEAPQNVYEAALELARSLTKKAS